jgi:hypothetical protein
MSLRFFAALGLLVGLGSVSASAASLDRDVEKLRIKAMLTGMVAEDQVLRMGGAELVKLGYGFDEVLKHQGLAKATLAVDRSNTEKLKTILKQWTWITLSEFGADASENAWLLAQHADQDVEFQEEALKRITVALKAKDVKPANFAYLWDRVQVNRSRPQRYGTQGICKGKGLWEPRPLEDAGKLDEYRKSVELSTFAEYLKTVAPYCF